MMMASDQNRFPQQQERRKRWGGCLGALSCFGSKKGCKRIAPASRIPEANAPAAQQNGQQTSGLANQVGNLAPPSSPASFTNSALPSTAQSPNCFLSVSANSPGGPSSTMFATGPYAHETQLVSPPVFSAFTTEPSTAPLTPPPELAHLTTPSSPDVPFAQFLTSSVGLKSHDKTTYALYPGSPALSCSYPEREFAPQWDSSVSPQNGKHQRTGSGRLYGHEHDKNGASTVSQDTNFFCPATFAQFYLDHNSITGGRLSVSKDSDVHPAVGNTHQNRQNRSPKQDAEELEAYRASFGFSADEIITTPQYVEISDVMDDSFTMAPLASNKVASEETLEMTSANGGHKLLRIQTQASSQKEHEDSKMRKLSANISQSSTPGNHASDDDDIFSNFSSSKITRKYARGMSCSDAEIEYRRGRSLREGKRDPLWNPLR